MELFVSGTDVEVNADGLSSFLSRLLDLKSLGVTSVVSNQVLLVARGHCSGRTLIYLAECDQASYQTDDSQVIKASSLTFLFRRRRLHKAHEPEWAIINTFPFALSLTARLSASE